MLAVLGAVVVLPGCRQRERGPILVGGREVKSWVKDLHDPRPQVRRQAVLKLGNVGDADPSAAEGAGWMHSTIPTPWSAAMRSSPSPS